MLSADAASLWIPPSAELARPAIIRPAEHALLRPGAFRPATREERRAIIADLVRSKRLTLAEAKRAMFLAPLIGGGGPANISYAQNTGNTSATSATTFTFPNQVFAGGQYVVMAIAGYTTTSSRTVSTVKLAGASAALVFRASDTTSVYTYGEIWIVRNPGAFGAAVITWSGAMDKCAVELFTIDNLLSPSARATASAMDNQTLTASIAIPNHGCLLALVVNEDGGSPGYPAWTGVAGAFADGPIGGSGNSNFSGGILNSALGATVSVTGALPSGISRSVMLLASFR